MLDDPVSRRGVVIMIAAAIAIGLGGVAGNPYLIVAGLVAAGFWLATQRSARRRYQAGEVAGSDRRTRVIALLALPVVLLVEGVTSYLSGSPIAGFIAGVVILVAAIQEALVVGGRLGVMVDALQCDHVQRQLRWRSPPRLRR
ncbi:MAG TPA: hypothetical protein VFX13_02075 [Gaiellales bacterium]|nr:hypothetical protein [Gaiellales bacterium]